MIEIELTPNEVDLLMDEDPENLSSQHIDQITAVYRKWRADYQAGVKPKKNTGQKQTLDVDSFVQNITKNIEGPKITPQGGGGMRR